jgi:ElaB/YqjD/DUF883 family membrane-anchored ribosome-binding protein
MASNSTGNVERGFDRAMGEARRQAENVKDSVANVAETTSTAARKTVSSFERAAREIIENQPYTAVMIALAVGWLLGRTRQPF